MAGEVVKKKGGRPKGTGGYQQLSGLLAKAFDKSISKAGGIERVSELVAAEIEARPLEALKVIGSFIPRNINVDMAVSPSDSLAEALANVQAVMLSNNAAKVIDAEPVDDE